MTNKKTILAIPLMVIAVIAIGFGMTSNVFAQTAPQTTVNQPDGPNDNIQSGDQTTNDAVDTPDTVDSQNDGETNDDHNSANQGPSGDGEQNDQTELKK